MKEEIEIALWVFKCLQNTGLGCSFKEFIKKRMEDKKKEKENDNI